MTHPTLFYAGVLAVWLCVLSSRVIGLRGNPVFKFMTFGTARPDRLERAIRGHGNLTEYAPIFLILMFLASESGLSTSAAHIYGTLLLAGRFLHGYLFCFGPARSLGLRVGGTALTLGPLSVLAVHGIILAL